MTGMSYKLLVIVCLSLAFFIPSACGINIAGSSNGAGFSVSMDLGVNDRVSMSAILGQNSVSSAIEGTGDLKEDHWVANRNGAFASVGVDIDNSTDYSYSYSLVPGSRLRKSETVEASESLDVTGADRISASAQARNGKGYSASTGVDITQGSLKGYSNHALASNDEVKVSQEFSRAEGDAVRLISTTGTWRSPKGKQPVWIAVRQGSDNPPEGSIDTEVVGTITGYRDDAAKSEDLSEINQNGHVEGAFRSTAIVGIESITRTSNYGTMYDLDMQSKIDGRFPEISGTLGYYVDNASPGANRIQGAVDAAESGDVINVLPGIYVENVAVEKSLSIFGAGAEKTVVNGNQGYDVFNPVFKIGEDNTNIDVGLSGLAITNGSGKITERGTYGGGIYNRGRLTIKNCSIYGRPFEGTVISYGGGIYNTGIAEIINSIISGNSCGTGGGIYNSGTVTITSSTISENRHGAYGGGVYNDGIATITDSNILGNSAIWGGGVYNNGTATITNSIISGNSGDGIGGGIYSRGMDTISSSTISENSAWKGGGISSYGTTAVKSSTISGNSASDGGGIANMGTVTITDSTISGNSAGSFGGGVANEGTATITNSTISENLADYGGGVYNYAWPTTTGYNFGMVTITRSIISGNSAEIKGGGVANDGIARIINNTISGNSAIFGGGVSNDGTAMIENSTISKNLAYRGGGVHNFIYGTKATITDSTISENLANYGGGVAVESIVALTNSKIWKNNAKEDGGGIYIFGKGIIEVLENSSITQNIANSNKDTNGIGGGIYRYWSGTLNFIDADGDGIVDPNAIVFDNYLGNVDENNIEPPL